MINNSNLFNIKDAKLNTKTQTEKHIASQIRQTNFQSFTSSQQKIKENSYLKLA